MAPTTAAAAQPAAGTPEYIRSAYVRALARATAARLVAYKNDDGSYDVPSTSVDGQLHTVRFVGRRWYDATCTCRAAHQIACLHRATAVFARKHHVSAVRPQAPRTWISAETGMAVLYDESPTHSAPASPEVMRSPEYRAAMAELIGGQDIWA